MTQDLLSSGTSITQDCTGTKPFPKSGLRQSQAIPEIRNLSNLDVGHRDNRDMQQNTYLELGTQHVQLCNTGLASLYLMPHSKVNETSKRIASIV